MKRFITIASILLFSVCSTLAQTAGLADTAGDPTSPRESGDILGIWENRSRFVEFSADGKMRIILKPYYGFVYEDTGWMPYAETPVDASPAPATMTGTIQSGSGELKPKSVSLLPSRSLHSLSVRYSGEKYDQLVPAAVIGDGVYFRFFRKDASVSPAAAQSAVGTQQSASVGQQSASGGSTSDATAVLLQGFWLASGNADALRLYKSEPVHEFYSFYFDGGAYYRIRYWEADVRERNLRASFESADGRTLTVPKFIRLGGALYTCVTSTGTKLRNYERGTYELKEGAIALKPESVVFTGTAAYVALPMRVSVTADGAVLAFGEPYLARSRIVDLDKEIIAHNGLRRPPRKPIFGYMELDFKWDEIERIRNNGRVPEKE